jgi:hypothetical protein
VSSVHAETSEGNARCTAIAVKACLSFSSRVNEEGFIQPLGVLNQLYCGRLILCFNTSVTSNISI